MTSFQSFYLIIFGIFVYLMWIDENILIYLTLILKILKINIERMIWMIRLHPRNPITNLMMKLKYDKIARQLQEELNVSIQDKESK